MSKEIILPEDADPELKKSIEELNEKMLVLKDTVENLESKYLRAVGRGLVASIISFGNLALKYRKRKK